MNTSAFINRDSNRNEKEMTAAELRAFLNNEDDFGAHDELSTNLQTQHGSIEPARRQVMAHALRYRYSKPGRDTLSSNTTLEGQINAIIDGQDVSWDLLSSTLRVVEFRLSCTNAATLLLSVCNIPLPKKQACSAWDPDVNDIAVAKLSRQNEMAYNGIQGLVQDAGIFPKTLGPG